MPRRWTTKDGDAPEITEEILAQMRPMSEVDPEFIKRFKKAKKKRGRPTGRKKTVVSVSMDTEILETLRASGSGWQSRMNELLKAALGLHPH